VDCLVLDRSVLLPYLGVEAMREKRLEWLAEDIKETFPYAEALYYGGSVYGALYISRREFPGGAFDKTLSDLKRLRLLRRRGLRASLSNIPSESRMISFLAAAATGGKLGR